MTNENKAGPQQNNAVGGQLERGVGRPVPERSEDPHAEQWQALAKAGEAIARSEQCGPDQAAAFCRAVDRLSDALMGAWRDDGMPISSDERHLRRLLAASVGVPGTYYDDGEAFAQAPEFGITIDFMREPVADVDAKIRALNVARALAASKTPNAEFSGARAAG